MRRRDLKADKLLQKMRARSSSPPPVHYPTNAYVSSYYVTDNSHYALSPKYLTMKALSARSLGFDAPLCLQKANSTFDPLTVRTRSAYEKARNCQPRLTYNSIDPKTHKMFVPNYISDPPCLNRSRILNRSSAQYNDQFMNKYNDESTDDEADPLDEPYGSLHNKHRVHNHVIGSAMKIPDCIRRNSSYKHYFIHHPEIGHKLTLPKRYMKDDPIYKRANSLPRITSGKTNVRNTQWTSGPSYSKEMCNLTSYGGFPKFDSYVIREVPGQPPEMLTYSYDVPQRPKIST